MKWLELRFTPLLVLCAFAGAMLAVAEVVPALSFALDDRAAIALMLAALGAGVALAGVLAFRNQGTTVNPLAPGAASSAVYRGVYRFSRNPMYLGFLLALAAWAVVLSNVLAALFLPGFVAYITQYQIKPEERALLTRFGLPFAQYMSRVGRWI